MEGEGQARSLGNSRPNRLCAHNPRYSKVAHLSHLAKQQRKPGEDGVLASAVTSQAKARSPATRSHDKPTEDIGKRRHHSEMGGYIAKETTSNGNLRWFPLGCGHPKGWPHPEGRQRRRNMVEASPINQVQRRGTQVERAGLSREKAGQPDGPTKAKAHSVSLRQWPRTKAKSKPTQRRESNVTIADWGRTQTGPETGDLTWRPGTPQGQGIQRHSSTTRASQQVPDKEIERTTVTTSTAKLRRVDNQG